jgi:hypothetical protein
VGGNVFDPQSWNAYAYARNNPLRFIDPPGTDYIVAVEGGDPFWFDQGFGDYGAFDRYLRGQGFRPLGGSDQGYILNAAGQIVGEYSYFSRSARVFGGAGLLADRWLKEQLSDMAVGTAIAATGGLAAGALSGGLDTGRAGHRCRTGDPSWCDANCWRRASRGGVLSLGEIAAVRAAGRLLTQADGAIVRVLRVGDRFNVVVEGQRGIITTFKNLSHKSLDGLARRYGWK